MKTNKKVFTGALLMALMVAAAAANANMAAKDNELVVRDVLAEDVTKDVTGRVVRKAVEAPAANNVISDVKAQVSPANGDKRSVRFVAALDSYVYESVKFDVVVKDGDNEVKTYTREVTTAYTHIVANGETLTAAEAFGSADYNYMVAFTINNIPETAWDYTFEATASIKAEGATEYTTTDVATKVMNDMIFVDALGGADIFASITNKTSGKVYEWNTSVVDGAVHMTSTNGGLNSTTSTIAFELAKDSVVSFDYAVSSEKTYDDLFVYVYEKLNGVKVKKLEVSGDSTENFVTGSFIEKLSAGNVIELVYNKDTSTNRGLDLVNITNLSFTNGIPAVNITKVYNDGLTPDAVENGELMAELGEDVLAAPENLRGEDYQFGGWYYDAEFTQPASADDVHKKASMTLYANWLTKVVVNFVVPEGATAVAPVTVWSYTPMDVANPTMPEHIFRGWYLDENYETLVDIANDGVAEGCTLYAKFEGLPEGAARDVARKVVFEEGTTIWNARSVETTEEFQDYYFELTPTVTTEYFVVFENYTLSGYTGSTYASHARMWIEDSNGNVLYEEFQSGNTQTKYRLEANETYYLVFNGAKYTSSATSWGTFDLNVMYFNHNTADSALPYAGIDETVTVEPGTFTHRNEELVYLYTATETSGYALSFSSDAWAGIKLYEGSITSANKILDKSVYQKTDIYDVTFTEGETYYFVLSQNWNSSELASKTMSFKVMEYGEGYAANKSLEYVVGNELVADFSGGNAQYHRFTVDAETTYKVTTTGGTSSYTKYIEIYDANDLTTALFTLSGTSEVSDFVRLQAGEYIIKTRYANTAARDSFSVVVNVAEVGASVLNPIAVNLPEDNNVVAEMTGTGYYSFSTGSNSVFHFFTADDTTAVITIMDANGNTVATSTNGAVYVKLDAETDYVVQVTGTDLAITYHTATQIIDGKTADSAYVWGTNSNVLENEYKNSYTTKYEVWYKIEVAESGTYALYTLNNGSIDTNGRLYSADATTQLKYVDDGNSDQKAIIDSLGGYKYDFYMSLDLVAGETYYIKISYSVYSAANSSAEGVTLTFNVEKQ